LQAASSTIFCKTNGGNPGGGFGPNNYGWDIVINMSGSLKFYMASGGMNWGDPETFNATSNIQITDMSAWHHVAATVDRSSARNCRLFIDGIDVTGISLGTLGSVGAIDNMAPARIAIEADGDYPFSGSIDEVRMTYRARSADWLRLCYMNQKPRDALVKFQ
jgi:hypothetical protein